MEDMPCHGMRKLCRKGSCHAMPCHAGKGPCPGPNRTRSARAFFSESEIRRAGFLRVLEDMGIDTTESGQDDGDDGGDDDGDENFADASEDDDGESERGPRIDLRPQGNAMHCIALHRIAWHRAPRGFCGVAEQIDVQSLDKVGLGLPGGVSSRRSASVYLVTSLASQK
mmetsp:Transcript_2421/g.6506  ORF Transcript_2421/g.6506 Transcript_2421/m.6506 type:complete len:169 (-) Transcript_2421:322-828(-)